MNWKKIIIHCSATTNGKVFSASDIDKWHKGRGWKGIGYNYVIKTDGIVEFGRALNLPGAHTRGYNTVAIGICLIGTDKFSEEQFIELRKLILHLMAVFNIPLDEIHGHREYAKKSCPGFDAYYLRRYIDTDDIDFLKDYLLGEKGAKAP